MHTSSENAADSVSDNHAGAPNPNANINANPLIPSQRLNTDEMLPSADLPKTWLKSISVTKATAGGMALYKAGIEKSGK
ncbi:hypothetical protein L2725_19610 [Shewanella corallii]|uniref:Uncharacterized protein n=1 Tax=Shewanella corallii TaxID=560080 RepID=A0ABT0NBT7_9GAMM|nr:hypothetical protein [Shewanella corallii]MCL2915954.1 hypothetical protein [Shewanella corallii]